MRLGPHRPCLKMLELSAPTAERVSALGTLSVRRLDCEWAEYQSKCLEAGLLACPPHSTCNAPSRFLSEASGLVLAYPACPGVQEADSSQDRLQSFSDTC